jgi:hypothetical protein
MFLTAKPILTLHVNGQAIRTTPDHPFHVHGQGRANAADPHPGARFRVLQR